MGRTLFWIGTALLAAAACGENEAGGPSSGRGKGKSDSSSVATFLNFEIDGELLASSATDPEDKIREQLFYTVGPLNNEDSVGRLDKIQTSDIKTEPAGEMTRITYRAILPVAWGKPDEVPGSWTLKLPRDVSWSGIQSFFEKYKETCVSYGAHDMSASIFWYDYRTHRSDCHLDPADVVVVEAKVTPNPLETSGRFPEYHKVWEDKALKVVSIFGLDEAAEEGDLGVRSYRQFIGQMMELLGPHSPTTEPAELPEQYADVPAVTIRADLPGDRSVEISSFLVHRMTSTTADFDQAYNKVSKQADLIAYNGHSGVGANIRALARKGTWVAGQYVIVFMNGCDTYAYQDSALADAHRAVNPDDVNGTKYVDLILNAMPAGWNLYRDDATTVLVKGLLDHESPRTFQRMFLDIAADQVVLVAGEEDNVYVPGYPGDGSPPVESWGGLDEQATLGAGEERTYATPKLAPGRYEFTLSGDGNADLYLRVGTPATTSVWDCRPQRQSSSEVCRVDLPTAAALHLLLRGVAQSSTVDLSGVRR